MIKKKWGERSVFIIINENDEAEVRSTEDGASIRLGELLNDGELESDIFIYEARLLDFSVDRKITLKEDC